MRRFVSLLGLAVVLSIVWVPALAVAGGGNWANAKMCQKGGWQTLERSDGTAFATQSDCVSYAAGGGTVFAPTLSVPSPVSGAGVGSFTPDFTITGTGFHASSSGTLTAFIPGLGTVIVARPSTDASGDFTF